MDANNLDSPIIHSSNNRSATICLSVLFKAFFYQLVRNLADKETGKCKGIIITLLIPSFINPLKHQNFILKCFEESLKYFRDRAKSVKNQKDNIPYYFRFESEAFAAIKYV